MCLDGDSVDETFLSLKSGRDFLCPDINKWFLKTQAKSFETSMPKSIRIDAGLAGLCESVNSLLKTNISGNSTLLELHSE